MHSARKPCRMAAGMLSSLLLTCHGTGFAGAVANFQVSVRLVSASQGVCVSGLLEASTDYQVSCASEQFVDMAPRSTLPLVNADGTAYRFHMLQGMSGRGGDAPLAPRLASPQPATSVAAMRVSSGRDGSDGQVEILVSF